MIFSHLYHFIVFFYRRFAILLESTFSLSFGIQMLIVTVGMSISLVQVSYL